jgi:AraC-like DNA-binding protein
MFASVYSELIDQNLVIVPTACNFTHILADSSSLYHIHKVYHVFVAFSGTFSIRTDRGVFRVRPEEVAIINPNETHIFLTDPDEVAHLLAFKFYVVPAELCHDGEMCRRLFQLDLQLLEEHGLTLPLQEIVGFRSSDIHVEFEAQCWSQILALADEIRPFGRDYELDVTIYPVYPALSRHHSEFTYFFMRLCELLAPASNRADRTPSPVDGLVRDLIRAIEGQAGQKFSLERLSSYMGYSASYLSAYFSRKMGMTLHEYHEKLRIHRACELLRDTDLPVTDIAHELQYSSSQHFSHRFAEITGLPPSRYRKHIQAAGDRFVQPDESDRTVPVMSPGNLHESLPGFPNCRVLG